MLSKSNVHDILRDSLNYIRELSRNTQNTKNLEQIYSLSDIMHNIPTLLYEWDALEVNEPEKLEFLTNFFEREIKSHALNNPKLPSYLLRHLNS